MYCLYAWEWIDTYHRSRSCFWQDLEESVINRHVLKVEWCQLGHGGDGLSTQPGCLRVENKLVQSQFLDLWKNVCWTINSRDSWKLWKKTSTFSHDYIYIILDILKEDTRKYWTRCDNIGRVEDESNIVTSSPNISLYPRKQEIQYYYYYLDHPNEMMNSLSEQKNP